MIKYPKYYLITILLGGVIFASGCGTIKAPTDPETIWTPPKWEKTTKAVDPVWKAIRDRKVDADRPLALVELIDMALGNNPGTRQAWEEARAAFARERQAESTWYPQVTVSADTTYQKLNTNNTFAKQNKSYYGPEAQATLLLLDFGGRAATVREAKQMLIAANYQFNQAIQDLILETQTAYYSYYSSKSAVEAALADVANAKTSYEAAQQKLRAGLAVKLDVLQAKSNYDDSLYNLEEAKAQLKTAKGDLAKVLGLSADTDFEIEEPVKDVPTGMSEEDVSALIEEALRQRPDIGAQRASLRAKEAALAAANSDLWPTLNAGGSMEATWYKYYGSEKSDQFNVKDSNGYTAYLSVNWNIFDGFYLYSKRNETKADAAAEHEKLKQAELEASADVWSKYYNFRAAVQKRQFSRAFYESSSESFDLASQGYKAGLKNILDLLQAQSNLSSARSRLIQSEKDLYVAFAELLHATGAITAQSSDVSAKVITKKDE
jgi:outer membrane protein